MDRESAYEMLKARAPQAPTGQAPDSKQRRWQSEAGELLEAFGKSAVRAIGSSGGPGNHARRAGIDLWQHDDAAKK